ISRLNLLEILASHSWLYHFRKRLSIYIWPLLAGGAIFLDWNHTREWKANGRRSVLQGEILPDTQPLQEGQI
ncbi:hypothetical protein GCK32_017213, partial [Trichostrongylus colubriformis]